MFDSIRNYIAYFKNRIKDNNFDSLLWIVNGAPSIVGFNLRKDKIWAPFFVIHMSLLTYVYGVGNVMYQVKYAKNTGDFIESYVNITIMILAAVSGYWFIVYRPPLRVILNLAEENDRLSKTSPIVKKKREKLLATIKIIVFIFYGCNLTNATFVYLPHRVDILSHYAMQPCVGLEPLTSSPNREICLTILCAQELSIMTVVLNYQALWLVLVAHTAVMYQVLSEEMLIVNTDEEILEDKLLSFIHRHNVILDITHRLKEIYSMPIGMNLGVNAICMCLFFFMPLSDWFKFMPILVYCFVVFFLNCFLCQRLINASEEFERAVYGCGWENFDVIKKKWVYIMLMNSQKPAQLLAADIIPVNIATFATTMQSMYKFITVFKL
uniref:Odorant receptor n=1 Tax=Histia rhodope TaxID=1453155 RepID=A0A7G4KBW6_9NEOP|nr:odorant receptor [Histia rhodope]